MGEAKKRGSRDQREKMAISRNKIDFAGSLGLMDDTNSGRKFVKIALQAIMNRIPDADWAKRKNFILESLPKISSSSNLVDSKSIRVREDEIAWYIFLCDKFINDPLCNDSSQSQRILPFFAALGRKWRFSSGVEGLDLKIDEMINKFKKDPDGIFFELLVALSYAEAGWEVKFIEEEPGIKKTPDMRIKRENIEFVVECKRLNRRTKYAEDEREHFIRLWDEGKEFLLKNNQWIWLKCTLHVEPQELPTTFFQNVWQNSLPIGIGEHILLDDKNAKIEARLIDKEMVKKHFQDNQIQAFSAKFSHILGQDWAPEDAAVTILPIIKIAQVNGCEFPLGTYIDDIVFACGMTRNFDSGISIDKKSKEIIQLLKDAIKQVPTDIPSIIHIAAESMEGSEVEHLRTEKVKARIEKFDFSYDGNLKRVALVRFHRLQAHQRHSIAFELDETVDSFPIRTGDTPLNYFNNLPKMVVVPQENLVHGIHHWDLYPD